MPSDHSLDTFNRIAKVAIVTGAAQGVGLGIAQVLASKGIAVALADVQADQAESEAEALRQKGFQAIGVGLDVVSTESWTVAIQKTEQHFGPLDVLVNNAGISPRGTAETTDEALWDRCMDINLKGSWLGIRAALPGFRARNFGRIINIGSTRSTRPLRGLFAYGVSKAGMLAMTQQVAVEYVNDGVTSNMVAPGWVDTPGERILQQRHGRPDFPDGLKNLITPADVGDAAWYLVGPSGDRVNGLVLYLDAGLAVADDAGMIYLPDAQHNRYEQRL
jgi:NAD(P)-dependent dehydrogenase (short-subunit alcohol dehydrogenase family)